MMPGRNRIIHSFSTNEDMQMRTLKLTRITRYHLDTARIT